MELLSAEWVEAVAEASETTAAVGRTSASVELTIGKTRSAVLSFVEGRVVGAGASDSAEVSVPFTEEQLTAVLAGEESLAKAYIRGDVKPVGSTGAFLLLVELAESGALSAVAS